MGTHDQPRPGGMPLETVEFRLCWTPSNGVGIRACGQWSFQPLHQDFHFKCFGKHTSEGKRGLRWVLHRAEVEPRCLEAVIRTAADRGALVRAMTEMLGQELDVRINAFDFSLVDDGSVDRG